MGVNDVEKSEIIVCGGGDGTLLKTIKKYHHLSIPFWGYNAGTVGFLMNEGFPEDYENEIIFKKFFMIEVTVHYKKKIPDPKLGNIYNKITDKKETFQAFNDVCIGGDMNSWIGFSVIEKDELFGDFKGGGVIISTPQGSTGVNKNNGGVVLPLSSNLWSITGDKTNRKIEYVIKPRKMVITFESRTPVSVWVDGSNNIIRDVYQVELKKGKAVTVAFGNYFEFQKKRRLP